MIVKFRELARIVALICMTAYTIVFIDLFVTTYLNPGNSIIIVTNDIGEGPYEMAGVLFSLPFMAYLFLHEVSDVGRCMACRLKYKK